jgi:hypothetical protein
VASRNEPAPTDEWRPAIGDVICTCGSEHLRVVELIPEDDDVDVVVEGGGSYSLRHCGLEPVPHPDWEHYPSLHAVLATPHATATWPEAIASLYGQAHSAAIGGMYSDTKSFCRQALRVAFASAGRGDRRLIDLITGSVDQGRLPLGIQQWATEIDLISSEGMRYEDHFHIRDYDASDSLLFTRTCVQILHDANLSS